MAMNEPNRQVAVLRASVGRLAAIVTPFTADDLRRQAYPTEWTVADVLSHLGSGAVIGERRLAATLTGTEFDNDSAHPIWDEWNAKAPERKAADALVADRSLLDRLASLTAKEQAHRFPMGPIELDFAGYVGLRLNEHALHSWDVAVTFDPAATVSLDAVELVVDTLVMIASFVGKPTGADRMITIATTAPVRHFEIALRADRVTFTPSASTGAPDVELTAEALIRLVYGRLDTDHTPPFAGSDTDLDELRRAFPGV